MKDYKIAPYQMPTVSHFNVDKTNSLVFCDILTILEIINVLFCLRRIEKDSQVFSTLVNPSAVNSVLLPRPD